MKSGFLPKIYLGLSILAVLMGGVVLGTDPGKEGWISWMLLVSVGLLMPLGEPLAARHRSWQMSELVAAVMAMGMMNCLMRPVGNEAVIFASSWFVVRCASAVEAVWTARRNGPLDAGHLCLLSARIFPAIGAAWLVAHRAGWAPWGFNPLIVLLTAAHFHHAGFTLPLMAGLVAKECPGCWTRFSCVAILTGVPLVAIGITCTHFGVLRFVEPFGVTVLVLGALGVVVSQLRLGLKTELRGAVRAGFLISGVSLLLAMLLALGFGLRIVVPHFALSMPQMWAIHGSLNVFGFGLCGILAWRKMSR